MSQYSTYFNRVKASGSSNKDAVNSSTKRQVYSYFMNSPSLSSVDLIQLKKQNDETFQFVVESEQPTIISDIETFYKRAALFLPDTSVQLGTYINYEDKTYLVTEANTDPIYPKIEMSFCNDEFELKGASTRIEIGKDEFGRPKYKTIQAIYKLPCVVESKLYSIAENSQLPLPDGAVNVLIPYHPDIIVPINYDFHLHDSKYQTTTISREKVVKTLNGKTFGYIVIRGQRGVANK